MRALTTVAGVAVLSGLALLGGCKKETVSLKDKSVEEVAKAVPSSVKPKPGLYETSLELVNVSMPGMNPQMQEGMKAAMARSMKTRQHCVTEEQAGKGYEERVKELASRPECKFDHYDLDGGALDAKLLCTGEKGMSSTMTMRGTVAPDGSDLTMKTEQSGTQLPGGGGIRMTVHVKSKRIGECPAGKPG